MSQHPPDETLAAFADGRLNPRDREEMIEHLASCDDCRAVYDAVSDAQAEGVIERAPDVVHGNFRKPLIGTLAVAAAATIVFFTPPVQKEVAEWRSGGVSELVDLTKSSPQRRIEGRVAGGFAYGDFRVLRNAEKEFDLEEEQLKAAATEVRSSRAKGLALLLAGEHDDAIAELTSASDRAGGDDPMLLNDLAAAYLDRSRFGNNRDRDLPIARRLAEKAWSLNKTPEIAWNRALAYEHAENKAKAKAAWDDYLALDSTSPWAQEVREKHLAPEL